MFDTLKYEESVYCFSMSVRFVFAVLGCKTCPQALCFCFFDLATSSDVRRKSLVYSMTFGLNLATFDSMALWRFKSKSNPDLIAMFGVRIFILKVLVASISMCLAEVKSKTFTVGDGSVRHRRRYSIKNGICFPSSSRYACCFDLRFKSSTRCRASYCMYFDTVPL